VADQVAELDDALRRIVADAVKALIMEVDANLREACPVDTGHARANFVPRIGAPFAGVASGPGEHDAGVASLLSFKLGDGDAFVTNNVPYIGPLIGGHSDQAPAGWDLEAIDKAVQTIQAQYDELVLEVSGSTTVAIGGGELDTGDS